MQIYNAKSVFCNLNLNLPIIVNQLILVYAVLTLPIEFLKVLVKNQNGRYCRSLLGCYFYFFGCYFQKEHDKQMEAKRNIVIRPIEVYFMCLKENFKLFCRVVSLCKSQKINLNLLTVQGIMMEYCLLICILHCQSDKPSEGIPCLFYGVLPCCLISTWHRAGTGKNNLGKE